MQQTVLSTAGGRIQCLRCIAQSRRTGAQCRRPALKSSRTQKCQFHGGRASGPKTSEGKARIAKAHLVHGNETQAARWDRSTASARLAQLEDAMYVLKMIEGPRTRGRKSVAYVPVVTMADIKQMMLENLLNSKRSSSDTD
jgi:hypothetical protein